MKILMEFEKSIYYKNEWRWREKEHILDVG
jgi:hypothetical protein